MKKDSDALSVVFLFDDTLDSSDGVAQYVKQVGSWMSQRGHQVSYFVGETKITQWNGGRVFSLAKNMKVKFNGNYLTIPLPARKKKIKQALKLVKPDVVHVMVPYSPFMSQKVINAAKETTPIVGTFHIFPASWFVTFGAKLLRIVYGRSIKSVSPIISVSKAAANFAQDSFRLKTAIVPNTIDIEKFKSNKPNDSKTKRIVFLGRLVKRKGCEQLIDAFSALTINEPHVKLIIGGDGPQRSALEKKVKFFGLEKKVEFLGYVKEADKPNLLASADIACFPSLYGESFGIVLLEAMAAGSKVVLGGDNPGYRSVLGDQPHLLIDPRSKQHFALKLQELLADQQLQKKIKSWQDSEIKKYDISTVGPQIEKIYREAIAHNTKKRHN